MLSETIPMTDKGHIYAGVGKYKKQQDKHKGCVPLENKLQVSAWEQKAAAKRRFMPKNLGSAVTF